MVAAKIRQSNQERRFPECSASWITQGRPAPSTPASPLVTTDAKTDVPMLFTLDGPETDVNTQAKEELREQGVSLEDAAKARESPDNTKGARQEAAERTKAWGRRQTEDVHQGASEKTKAWGRLRIEDGC